VNRFLRYASFVVGALVVLVGLLVLAAELLSARKLNRVVSVEPAPVAYVDDEKSRVRGKYLFDSRGCMECHGANGQGKVFIDDPNGMYVRTPNITGGGVTKGYSERDWVRAIRHGVKPDGKPLLIMPSEDYNRLTDVDLAALVAYTRSLPAAAGEPAEIRLPLIVKALYALGKVPDAAERIDHRLPPELPVEAAVSVAHGKYVANTCIGCHGEGYSGGKIAGGPPDWPPAANLTPGEGSAMARYPELQQFVAMMRSGKRPDGQPIAVMPFETLKQMNDTDLAALHAFLKTLPPRAAGGH
jgi:mono/diheme cytochrome c family protein